MQAVEQQWWALRTSPLRNRPTGWWMQTVAVCWSSSITTPSTPRRYWGRVWWLTRTPSPMLSIASALAELIVSSGSCRAWIASAIAVTCASSSPAAIWSSSSRSGAAGGRAWPGGGGEAASCCAARQVWLCCGLVAWSVCSRPGSIALAQDRSGSGAGGVRQPRLAGGEWRGPRAGAGLAFWRSRGRSGSRGIARRPRWCASSRRSSAGA